MAHLTAGHGFQRHEPGPNTHWSDAKAKKPHPKQAIALLLENRIALRLQGSEDALLIDPQTGRRERVRIQIARTRPGQCPNPLHDTWIRLTRPARKDGGEAFYIGWIGHMVHIGP